MYSGTNDKDEPIFTSFKRNKRIIGSGWGLLNEYDGSGFQKVVKLEYESATREYSKNPGMCIDPDTGKSIHEDKTQLRPEAKTFIDCQIECDKKQDCSSFYYHESNQNCRIIVESSPIDSDGDSIDDHFCYLRVNFFSKMI